MIFLGLAAFVPLFYYLAVVGGFVPFGAILLMTARNLSNASMLVFGLIHLVPYGVLLLSVAGLLARVIDRCARGYEWVATAGVMLALAGIGALPIFGVSHGRIRWTSAYELYLSNALR